MRSITLYLIAVFSFISCNKANEAGVFEISMNNGIILYQPVQLTVDEKKTDPQVIGTSYLTGNYAFSTSSRSSLWNQRRPFLVYWGNIQKPKYLQVRFLHDYYDFSCAGIYNMQKENSALSLINFSTNGGDKHISID